tara:strand:- start:24695 stop:25687 length:993 start_codon:yes stop_codon:yes gene_type:complete
MKHKILLTLFILFLIAIGGFFGLRYTGLAPQYIPPTENGEIDIYFCPEDNCENILVELISNSDNINCAFYDLDSDRIIESLEQKSNDIDVRLVSDNSNRFDLNKLDFVKYDDKKQLMHNKFCILNQGNENIVFTGSLNPTKNGLEKNENNLAVITSNLIAENYQLEFNELWNLNFGKGENVKYPKINFNGFVMENYFCPEDNCEEKVLNLIQDSKNRIYFMTFSFTSDPLGDLIIEKSQTVEVKGLFEKFQNPQYAEYDKMQKAGLDVKYYEGELLHHKVFIIDDTVVFGSYNPTKSGNEKNDENIIIIHDKEITDKFLTKFNSLFEKEE